MVHEDKIFFHYETEQNTNAGDFVVLLSEHLLGVKTKNRKRIVSCALELLQNNLIHNEENKAVIQVIETAFNYIVKIQQYMDNQIIENLIAQFTNINSIEAGDLRLLYQQNFSNSLATTGNGHVFCRIKSENTIDYYISDCNIFIIKLKFNKL